jgi:hypothetical protein
MDELGAKLAEKIRARSVWDEVFVLYFGDKQEWHDFQDQITKQVIPSITLKRTLRII